MQRKPAREQHANQHADIPVCWWRQVTHKVRSPWALPAALLVMPAIFFAVLFGPLRSDLAAARAAGWVTKNQVNVAKDIGLHATCALLAFQMHVHLRIWAP